MQNIPAILEKPVFVLSCQLLMFACVRQRWRSKVPPSIPWMLELCTGAASRAVLRLLLVLLCLLITLLMAVLNMVRNTHMHTHTYTHIHMHTHIHQLSRIAN